MDSTGIILSFMSFGESHGSGIGGVISGFPAGVSIDEDFLKGEISRRRGGSRFSTPRREADSFEILSGVFEGRSSGCAIGFFVGNSDVKSRDYHDLRDVFRPGHADFSYFAKYGIRDYRGGGRSSARESVARVLAGAFAKLLLREFGVTVRSCVYRVGKLSANLDEVLDDRGNIPSDVMLQARESQIFAFPGYEESFQSIILEAKRKGDSVGAGVLLCVSGMRAGLGEPLGYKLDSILARDLMGLNAVKGVEFGSGADSSASMGSINNDRMDKLGFVSNRCGGVLGGISNGNDLVVKIHFKPTPSIFVPQRTVDSSGNEVELRLSGRHDPCVGVRGSVVCEAIASLVIADMLLLGTASSLDRLKKVYG